AEDGIRDFHVTGVQTCALPIFSIDGKVEHWFGDDTPGRFESYGWNVVRNVDGHNVADVDQAIVQAKTWAEAGKGPTLICCRTIIGKGSPTMAGSEKVHGAPLGADEIVATREALNWPHEPFVIPDHVYQRWNARIKGELWQKEWQTAFDAYSQAYPSEAAELTRRMKGELPADFAQKAREFVQATAEKA